MLAVRTTARRMRGSWRGVISGVRTARGSGHPSTGGLRRTYLRPALQRGGLLQTLQTVVDVRTRMDGPEGSLTELDADDDGT